MAGSVRGDGRVPGRAPAAPGRILNKPGPLTPEEFAVVKLHPVYGEGIVSPIEHFREVAWRR